jgi:hypothetical protein
LTFRLLLVQGEEFLAINGNVSWCLNTQTNLATVDVHDRDTDVVADVDLFPEFATENQHGATLR